MMSFSESVKTCLTKKYATMSGRATRAEYWWFQLFWWLTTFAIILIGTGLGDKKGDVTMFVCLAFWVLVLIPNLCVCVRRLHDRGHSGAMFWWCILGWAFGLMVINIVNMFDSDEGPNEYGPDPNCLDITKGNLQNTASDKEVSSINNNLEVTNVDL